MASRVLVLWLEGPLQSWSQYARFYYYPTFAYPGKAALWGIVFNSMGKTGNLIAECERIKSLKATVYGWSSPEGSVMEDYQACGNGWDVDDPWEFQMIPKKIDGSMPTVSPGRCFRKEYLEDARFAVFLEIPSEWEDDIAKAMQHPARVSFLGRKCCMPSVPPFLGIGRDEKEAEEILSRFLEARSSLMNELGDALFCVRDTDPNEDCEKEIFYQPDNPVNFSWPSKRTRRAVRLVLFDNL